jgi:hypothetical protein
MWVSASNLPCRLQAYKNVLAFVMPLAIPDQLIKGKAGIHLSFAVSDPYLSRVSNFGRLEVKSTTCMLELLYKNRVGAILVTNHPSSNNVVTENLLLENWTKLRRLLQYTHDSTYHPSTIDDLLLAPHISTDRPTSESSAVEADEVDNWRALCGCPNSPGPAAAAVQLQGWLDDSCGGWPNSFG